MRQLLECRLYDTLFGKQGLSPERIFHNCKNELGRIACSFTSDFTCISKFGRNFHVNNQNTLFHLDVMEYGK